MSRNVASARAENPMTLEQEVLTSEELLKLVDILSDETNQRGLDLLALGGVRTMAGLMTRLAAADANDRDLLLTAIRKVLKSR